MPTTNNIIKNIIMKVPPPFMNTRYGNRHTAPKPNHLMRKLNSLLLDVHLRYIPTAKPITVTINSNELAHLARSY